ncbi:MAG TPA: RNA-guided pseudouridylation complex pseudouridine synthase subunit Cbf5 [Candidatus Nanoarchaeia archaeon]|nr:RNA-guided pseudouridylation complex pseudouridine synthase subunit Cbf5 [Candidatus Nanoarchaeia archaeon]
MKLPSEEPQKIIVKKESTTNPEHGYNPEQRPIEEHIKYGIFNCNKTPGPTSHQVAEYVKNILHLSKAGNTGTLDPNCTGVLPITLEKATRVGQALLKAGKEYICYMKLHDDKPETEIRKAFEKFLGTITQMPPVKSAVKRQLRDRKIYYLDIMEIDGRNVLFKVGCQAGTYIRTLCVDIGKNLGTNAHMQQLVRTKAGPFTYETWKTLHDLQDAYINWKEDGNEKKLRACITPYEKAVDYLPKIWVFDSAVNPICNGAEVYVTGISKFNPLEPKQLTAIMTLKNELIGLGISHMDTDEILKLERGVAVKTDAVFLDKDLYPKQQRTD